jgi:hypothetical protein
MAFKKTVAGTVLDPTIQFSSITIDEQTYKLCYSFNSLAIAEKNAGCNLLRGIESLQDLSAIQLRGLLYAALLVAHPDITIEQAAHLIRIDTLGPVTLALAEAYTLSMPVAKKNEPGEQIKTQTPTP